MHCKQHTQKPISRDCQAFTTLFPCWNLFFLIFVQEKLSKQPKNSHFVDFDWKNASKWVAWHIYRVPNVLYPMTLVWSLYNKSLLKNQNFRRSVKWGTNNQNGMGPMQQCFLGPILPLHHVSKPSCQNTRKIYHKSESTCHTKF